MRKQPPTSGGSVPPAAIPGENPAETIVITNSVFRNPAELKVKTGRPPRPPRTVVQARYRVNGKIVNSFSITVDVPFHIAIWRIQEAFPKEGKDYRRHSDDPRWSNLGTRPAAIPGSGGVNNA